jgi:TonB family protein
MQDGPVRMSGPQPTYPLEAALSGTSGHVVLSFDLDDSGRPINIAVVSAFPRNRFEDGARRALEKSRFCLDSKHPEKNRRVHLTYNFIFL